MDYNFIGSYIKKHKSWSVCVIEVSGAGLSGRYLIPIWIPNAPRDRSAHQLHLRLRKLFILPSSISCACGPHLYNAACGCTRTREKQVIWLMFGMCFNLEECYFSAASSRWSVWFCTAVPRCLCENREGDQYRRNTPETFYFIKHSPIKSGGASDVDHPNKVVNHAQTGCAGNNGRNQRTQKHEASTPPQPFREVRFMMFP